MITLRTYGTLWPFIVCYYQRLTPDGVIWDICSLLAGLFLGQETKQKYLH
jgi:hypothetical protein